MPTLEGIREFAQVVESGSFSRAAEKLGLSVAQVSRQVTHLENKVGVRLLYRSTRKIALTEEGELYYTKCKQALGLLENVELEVGRKVFEPSGTLKINLAGAFQEIFMVPILIDFRNKYPKLEVSVTFTDNNINLIQEGCDVSICLGELDDSSLIAKKMASARYCIVASKAYLETHTVPQVPEDLAKHNCVSGFRGLWQLSYRGRFFQQPVEGNWKSDNAHAVLSAVRMGVGLGYLPVFGVYEAINDGSLVEVMQSYTRKGVPVWIVYPNRNHISAKVRFFIDYLADYVKMDLFDEETRRNFLGD